MSVALELERKYTVDEWFTWDEGYRCELIDGELFELPPPLLRHQRISRKIQRKLEDMIDEETTEVLDAPVGVRLSEHEQTVLEPDIIVVCDLTKLADGKICEGAPDMVVEILSPSTSSKDKVLKLNKYLQAGVREYWIVDPSDETVCVNILENGNYRIRSYSKTDVVPVHILQGCEIDLNNVFS